MNLKLILTFVLCVAAFSAFAAQDESAPEFQVAVPAHDIARGDVISEGDLSYKSISVQRPSLSLVGDAADAVGKEARRPLRAGEFIRLSDLKRPTLVAKGSTVTLVFEAPGMQLTSVGRALAEGGQGDTIAVLNPTSYRQVQATVVAPGVARVGGPNVALQLPSGLAAAQP